MSAPPRQVSWEELVAHCSYTLSERRKKVATAKRARTVPDVAEWRVLIGELTEALIVPLRKAPNRYGMIVCAPNGTPDEKFWSFTTEEQLERFKTLVDSGAVARLADD